MSVAKVIEVSATSSESFDDAVRQGIAKAGESVRNIKSAWVKEQIARVGDDGSVTEFQVNLKITFVLE
jgi:flavin-binding protein dodecin